MPASPLVALGDEGLELSDRILLVDDLVADVRAVEAGDELWRVGKPEPVDDFLAGKVVGGRGQRDPRHRREALGEHGQADIFGTEIMPPLRHAMCLVDRKQRDAGATEQREAARRQEPLGRDVEQVQLACDQLRLDRRGLARGQGGIEHCRPDPDLDQARDLVAHQCDQRGDHDTAAFPQQRRQLIAQRFAAAGRHQHQAVAATGDMADDLLLFPPKRRQAEHGIEDGDRIAGVGCAGASGGGGGNRHGGWLARQLARVGRRSRAIYARFGRVTLFALS